MLEKNELIDQAEQPAAIVYWGHAPNSQTRGLEMKKAMDKLDLMVVDRSVSVGHRGDGGDAGRRQTLNRTRGLPAAGGHAVRDLRAR